MSEFNRSDEDRLYTALIEQDLEEFKYLIRAKANINKPDLEGTTLLLNAVEFGYFEFMKHLVEQGANLEAMNYRNQTALCIACEHGDLRMVKFLVDNGAKTQYVINLYDVVVRESHSNSNDTIRENYIEIAEYLKERMK